MDSDTKEFFTVTGDGLDEILRRSNSHAALVEALEAAVQYLEANRPKGDIRRIFTQLNQHENGVLKPARAALQAAQGGDK